MVENRNIRTKNLFRITKHSFLYSLYILFSLKSTKEYTMCVCVFACVFVRVWLVPVNVDFGCNSFFAATALADEVVRGKLFAKLLTRLPFSPSTITACHWRDFFCQDIWRWDRKQREVNSYEFKGHLYEKRSQPVFEFASLCW